MALGVYARIVFNANIDGVAYTIDGVHDIGANASNGTHTVTWTLPSGVKASGCTMTAQLLTADNPSGDDYMVVDLADGTVSYEGLLANQAASNARYTSDDTYKKSKLVLRKVPAGGPYRTGHANYSNASMPNSPIDRTTTSAYYIGIFPVTQYQYTKLCAASVTDSTLPNTGINWNTLRASAATAAQIPSVDAADTGSFFQRLNYKTGLYFDLPTEVMFEIAMRAGRTTVFYWGDAWNGDKVNYSSSAWETVGSRDSNDWGLYNMNDNPPEILRDNQSAADLATLSDPFVPSTVSSDSRAVRGGAYNSNGKEFRFHASYRDASGKGASGSASAMGAIGFRVACVMK